MGYAVRHHQSPTAGFFQNYILFRGFQENKQGVVIIGTILITNEKIIKIKLISY